ncbi:MAG: DUF6514 family protein [Bacillota bacterium]|nr:DUF6514 family protein [Bacillota bacterium]
MKRQLYNTVILKDDCLRLDYYIITAYRDAEDLQKEIPTYGLEINQVPTNTFSQFGYISTTVEDITADYGKICEFANLLSVNEIDPSILFDVVNDKLDEGFFDKAN